MRKIILSTESGADLPIELVEKHNLQVVPMHVVMDGHDYLDEHFLIKTFQNLFTKFLQIFVELIGIYIILCIFLLLNSKTGIKICSPLWYPQQITVYHDFIKSNMRLFHH